MEQIVFVPSYVPDVFYVAMITLSAFIVVSANHPSLFSPHTSIRGLEATLAWAVIFSSSISIDALSFYGERLLLVSAIRPRCFIHL